MFKPTFQSTESKKEIDYIKEHNVSDNKKEHLSMVVCKKVVGAASTISTFVAHSLEQLLDCCHRTASVS